MSIFKQTNIEFKEFSRNNKPVINLRTFIKEMLNSRFICILFAAILLGIYAGYYLNNNRFYIEGTFNGIFIYVMVLITYMFLVSILIFLSNRTKNITISQGVNACVSYMTAIIGAKYFIYFSVALILFVNAMIASLFISSGEISGLWAFMLMGILVNTLMIFVSVMTPISGMDIINYVKFITEKCFELIPSLKE